MSSMKQRAHEYAIERSGNPNEYQAMRCAYETIHSRISLARRRGFDDDLIERELRAMLDVIQEELDDISPPIDEGPTEWRHIEGVGFVNEIGERW